MHDVLNQTFRVPALSMETGEKSTMIKVLASEWTSLSGVFWCIV